MYFVGIIICGLAGAIASNVDGDLKNRAIAITAVVLGQLGLAIMMNASI